MPLLSQLSEATVCEVKVGLSSSKLLLGTNSIIQLKSDFIYKESPSSVVLY